MILIIDNYDSFVYNLAQYIGEMRGEPSVYRNDAISLEDIDKVTHLAALNFRSQVLPQVEMASMSAWSWVLSSSLVISLKLFVSSANISQLVWGRGQ